jgi:uncharacterized protein
VSLQLTMLFEWDDAKNEANLQKHGLSFEEARLIFDGPVLTVQDRRHEYGEDRFITLGAIAQLIVVVAIHTDRKGVTRFISARLANRKERLRYHVHISTETEIPGRSDG